MKGRRLTIKKQIDRDTLIIWIKYFSGLKITDDKLVWLLRDYFDIDVSRSTIKSIKRKFLQKNLT